MNPIDLIQQQIEKYQQKTSTPITYHNTELDKQTTNYQSSQATPISEQNTGRDPRTLNVAEEAQAEVAQQNIAFAKHAFNAPFNQYAIDSLQFSRDTREGEAKLASLLTELAKSPTSTAATAIASGANYRLYNEAEFSPVHGLTSTNPLLAKDGDDNRKIGERIQKLAAGSHANDGLLPAYQTQMLQELAKTNPDRALVSKLAATDATGNISKEAGHSSSHPWSDVGMTYYEKVAYWLKLSYAATSRQMATVSNLAGGVIDASGGGAFAAHILWQSAFHAMNPQIGQGRFYIPGVDYSAAPMMPNVLPLTADSMLRSPPMLGAFSSAGANLPSITMLEYDSNHPTYGRANYGRGPLRHNPSLASKISTAIAGDDTAVRMVAELVVRGFGDMSKPTSWLAPLQIPFCTLTDGVVVHGDGNTDAHSVTRKRAQLVDAAVRMRSEYNDMSDEETGVFLVDGTKDGDAAFAKLAEDATYVPFYIKDLRKESDGCCRYLMFRAFIESIRESFAPQVTSENYYGRSDPVLLSDSTVARTIDISFKMVAFSPEDLPVIYRKQAWLESMIYNEYRDMAGDVKPQIYAGSAEAKAVGDVQTTSGDSASSVAPAAINMPIAASPAANAAAVATTAPAGGPTSSSNERKPIYGLYRAPLLEARIGDLICAADMTDSTDPQPNLTSAKGVRGKITALSFDYGKYVWETTQGSAVPMAIDVSMSFAVSHEQPIRITSGRFESSSLRKYGYTDSSKGIWISNKAM